MLAPFGAVLGLLAVWQRRIDARERSRVVDDIREARSLGADRPTTQHPNIEPLLCIGCSSCARACPERGVLELIDGIARVVRGSACIGHGLCAEACPVGAITIGLGELADRPDVPRLSNELESTVPGLFIAGELGGIALIRNAVEQGIRAVEAMARRTRAVVEGPPDVLVVGAGPCGLAATLKSKEAGLRCVTIDQSDVGGTVRTYPRRKLVLMRPVALPLGERLDRREYRKEELIDHWEGLLARHAVSIRSGVKLIGVERIDEGFETQTSAGPIRSRFVLLALGRRGTPRRLGVPGEESGRVFYRLIDAASFRGQQLLVVGGGDSAIEAATALASQPGNRVTISYRKPAFFRLKRRNLERCKEFVESGRLRILFSSRVERIEPDRVHLTLASGASEELANDQVFVFAGGEPPYPLLQSAGVGMGRDA